MLNKSQTAAILVIILAAAAGALFVMKRTPSADFAYFQGNTMGTTWSVRLAGPVPDSAALAVIQNDIELLLQNINREMSIYDPESIISEVNRLEADVAMNVPETLYGVMRFSLDLANLTGGAFDPTVGPLVNLWGFGPDGAVRASPGTDQIEAARSRVGFEKLKLPESNVVLKTRADVYVDLGAVAKGFGVDAVAEMLVARGITSCLVEIGGEVRALGMRKPGRKWRIGVQRPNYRAPSGSGLQGVLHLAGMAAATSGDYQNFYVTDSGQTLSHIIDPRTAAPAGHSTAGVTVLAPDCMTADGWATALYVLGPEAGLPLVEAQPGLEALFVIRENDQSFREMASSGFAALADYEPAGLETGK